MFDLRRLHVLRVVHQLGTVTAAAQAAAVITWWSHVPGVGMIHGSRAASSSATARPPTSR